MLRTGLKCTFTGLFCIFTKMQFMDRRNGEIFYSESSGRNFIKINGKFMRYAIYVAKTHPETCGEWFEGCEVHHLNGIKTDDRPENLICLTKAEHHRVHTKAVDVFYKNRYIDRYPSISEAALKNNLSIGAISFYCKYQKPHTSTYNDWRFALVR